MSRAFAFLVVYTIMLCVHSLGSDLMKYVMSFLDYTLCQHRKHSGLFILLCGIHTRILRALGLYLCCHKYDENISCNTHSLTPEKSTQTSVTLEIRHQTVSLNWDSKTTLSSSGEGQSFWRNKQTNKRKRLLAMVFLIFILTSTLEARFTFWKNVGITLGMLHLGFQNPWRSWWAWRLWANLRHHWWVPGLWTNI